MCTPLSCGKLTLIPTAQPRLLPKWRSSQLGERFAHEISSENPWAVIVRYHLIGLGKWGGAAEH
jgi:hypothetical protein